MTAEQTEKLTEIINEALTPIKTQIEKEQADWLKESAEADEARKKEHTEKMAKLEELAGKYEKSLDELAKAKERQEAPAEPDSNNPFKSFGHFAYDLMRAGAYGRDASDELKAWNAHCKATMNASELEEGGALIPTEFSSTVMERLESSNTILQNAMVVPMGTNKLDMPMITGFDETQGVVYGNTIWYWKGEDATLAGSNFETGLVELVLRKCTGLSVLTDELVKFSPQSIESILNRAFEKGMNFAINKAGLRGSGVGEPQGVLNCEALITIPKAVGQAADTFVYDNVLDMLAQLYSADDEAIGNGNWYMNKTLLPQVGKLNVVVGAGGAPIFISNVADKPTWSLCGMPIRWSTQMSSLGDVLDTALIDWSQVLIGQPAVGGPGAPTMDQSIHLYFLTGKNAFRFVFYMDIQPWWPETFKPKYGDEQSPYVTLAAR